MSAPEVAKVTSVAALNFAERPACRGTSSLVIVPSLFGEHEPFPPVDAEVDIEAEVEVVVPVLPVVPPPAPPGPALDEPPVEEVVSSGTHSPLSQTPDSQSEPI